MTTQLETDYLILGSGAMGMAFADVMLSETEHDMIIVDMHHKPGGHWNDAYSFVTLHQPSSFYGVSSKELSRGVKDETGLNKGLADLATGPEILSYFDDVMRHRFLPSGRVRYFPMCEYIGDGQVKSLLSGETFTVKARQALVDATYLKTSVPSTHTPSFAIHPDVWFIPPNGLPSIKKRPSDYVIVGGGKTAIDTVLWLLENNASPDSIRWIRPADSWYLDRKNAQTAEEFFFDSIGTQAAQFEALAAATSVDDLFDRLEAVGAMLRIDKTVAPANFRGATVSQAEIVELAKVTNVVRMGRVKQVEAGEIILDKGAIPIGADTLLVDCSASAVANLEITDVFADDAIRLQTVRMFQPVFSAAFIAHVEASYTGRETKNTLCRVVPLPKDREDWLRMQEVFMINQFTWSQDAGLRAWMLENRLDGFSKLTRSIAPDDEDKQAIMNRLKESGMPAMENLQKLLATLN
ncbi:MAG: NAD(P)/FAD-dependent oxidoreductase [Pseudomonadota bacterium]